MVDKAIRREVITALLEEVSVMNVSDPLILVSAQPGAVITF